MEVGVGLDRLGFGLGFFYFDLGFGLFCVSEGAWVLGADGFQVGVGEAEGENLTVGFGGQLFGLDALVAEDLGHVFGKIEIEGFPTGAGGSHVI